MRALPVLVTLLTLSTAHAETRPLKALLVAGGCCHDYAKQHEVISKGIQSRANVKVDVIWTDDKSTNPPLPLYEKADWAKGYDIIIHDECAASQKDKEVLTRILDAHKTIPAVHLHCAMHSFRTGEDRWFRHLGLQSNSHGPQEPIAIAFVDKEHPITKKLADWTTINEELYNNVNVFDAHPLAMGRQMVKGKAVDAIVAWTNEKAGARSFSTTIGHNNETVADARYLDLVTRGLLWACDKLTPDYLTLFTGQNKVTFVKAIPIAEKGLPPPAKDATLVVVTASTEEPAQKNYAWRAVDGDNSSRWCATDSTYPQWLQLELPEAHKLTGITIRWEGDAAAYRYNVEGSSDGKSWNKIVDASQNTTSGPGSHQFNAPNTKYVRIVCLKGAGDWWASIKEVTLAGDGIKSIAPKLNEAQQKQTKSSYISANDLYAKEGNIPPTITQLTPEQEAAILNDVKVAEGFEVTLFANSAAANYPVFIAAAPDGTLYVSSDGNGSLGRNPKRGRIIRLRDLDGDGRADETKVFCEVDSPRGLVWDHDRLYLVHPPHLSEFIDADHDGVAEKQNILVKDIAFGFKDRPADHTTNGLSLGIDGWLYIAGGDFGFLKATGTDGRTLQHRGGGVIRVRPDGSGLEIYSTGTRNILEVASSPLMDIFARDNTNDGGGWNVRFHHFTGLDDHGYPRLFKNFPDECIGPLADYGGGSGCGAVYIDEPGFGEWNNAPFTCDWGTGALYHHKLKPKGATFEEVRKPEPFVKMTRPTDADVDAMSHLYVSSWKGATFNWEGPDVGYIVRITPGGQASSLTTARGFQPSAPKPADQGQRPRAADRPEAHPPFKPEPLPDFAKASDVELVKVLESASHRRRLEAQRSIIRVQRSHSLGGKAQESLLEAFCNNSLSPATRLAAVNSAALFRPEDEQFVARMVNCNDALADSCELIVDWCAELVRTGAVTQIHGAMKEGALAIVGSAHFQDNPRLMARGYLALQRLVNDPSQMSWFNNPLHPFGETDADPLLCHLAVRSVRLAAQATTARPIILKSLWERFDRHQNLPDKPQTRLLEKNGILLALAGIHKPEVVTGLIERLGKATAPALRQGILAALCRLHFKEGEWKGDSWGTRPDTRGPYYQPEAWSETPKIAVALKGALAKASPEEAAFLVKELNRNRIQSSDALQRILALAKQNAKVIPDAVAQLAVAEEIPAEAVPLLVGLVRQVGQVGPVGPATLSQGIIALSKTDSAEGVSATLAALEPLKKLSESSKDYEAAFTAFLNAPKLENHHQLVEQIAEKSEWPVSMYANAALLNLANRKTGSPESIQLSQQALDKGWANPKHRKLIIDAISASKHMPSAAKVLAGLDDPDVEVKGAAERAAKSMRITKIDDKTPKLMTLKPEEALAAVLKEKGDIALGEQIFTKATCVACHTVKETEAQKGPYLGNIAQTYKRPDLALNILDPNKTIAQGFASELITLKDGTQQMGFITLEGAAEVKIRNIAAQEFTYKTADIAKRDKLPMSIMPPGLMTNFTVKEFASLLDYLESLVKK